MDKKANILLTGFRATGKTVVGKKLAELLRYQFVDTDEIICQREKMSVAEIVRQQGWSGFRRSERAVLREFAAARHTVLAVGGGAIEHVDIWPELKKQCTVVWLQTEITTILKRLQADTKTEGQRPALTDESPEEEVRRVLSARTPLYRTGADICVCTEGKSPEQLAVELMRDFFSGVSAD